MRGARASRAASAGSVVRGGKPPRAAFVRRGFRVGCPSGRPSGAHAVPIRRRARSTSPRTTERRTPCPTGQHHDPRTPHPRMPQPRTGQPRTGHNSPQNTKAPHAHSPQAPAPRTRTPTTAARSTRRSMAGGPRGRRCSSSGSASGPTSSTALAAGAPAAPRTTGGRPSSTCAAWGGLPVIGRAQRVGPPPRSDITCKTPPADE